MSSENIYPLTVFYDGSCRVCSREMDHYRRRNPQRRLNFIDITQEDFSPEAFGRTRQQFMAELHVRDASGRFYAGVDAFLALWCAFPAGSLYRLFGLFVSMPGLHLAAQFGYALFARNRHLLPKQSAECESENCNLNHPRH